MGKKCVAFIVLILAGSVKYFYNKHVPLILVVVISHPCVLCESLDVITVMRYPSSNHLSLQVSRDVTLDNQRDASEHRVKHRH